MKRIFALVFLAAVLCSSVFGQTVNVMTYNLRYDNPEDGVNRWDNRKDLVLSQINYYEPDVFGIQEGLESQVDWLDDNLDMFSYVGVGREDGKNGGEYSAVFYNSDKFNLLDSGTFWLSETPEKPSKGWDAACIRICTYALLEYKNGGKKFWMFNTHFDHVGDIAREKSPLVILGKMDSLNVDNYPVFLTGDFNLTSDTKPIMEIKEKLDESYDVTVAKPFGPEGTFNGFEACKPLYGRIDHIFISRGNVIVNKYAALLDMWENRYPSDHLPVLINATFK